MKKTKNPPVNYQHITQCMCMLLSAVGYIHWWRYWGWDEFVFVNVALVSSVYTTV